MTSDRTESGWPRSGRGLATVLVVSMLAALGGFVFVRSDGDGGADSEVVVAAEGTADAVQPRPSASEPAQGSESVELDAGVSDEQDPAGTQPATLPTLPPDLGLDDIVREVILGAWGGETVRAESDYVPSTYAKLESDDPVVRRRGEFELEVRVVLGYQLFDNSHYLQLFKLQTDSWDACLKEYGVPPLMELGQLSQEQEDALYKDLGLVGERMTQFVDKCWEQARIHADKDDETDRLLGLLHHDLLNVAQDWAKDNPDKAVPLPQ